MGLISWIIQLIPDSVLVWAAYLMISSGAILYGLTKLAAWLPGIGPYKLLAELLGIALLVAGAYLFGGVGNELVWRERVANVEAKVAAAEEKSKEENIKIVEKVVKKLEIVRIRGEDIIKYVDREVVKYDVKFAPGGICEIPQEFITAHNRAAEAVPK